MDVIALAHLTEHTTALLCCCSTADYFQVVPNGAAITSFWKGLKTFVPTPAVPNIRPKVQSKIINGPQGFNLSLLCNYYKSASKCHIFPSAFTPHLWLLIFSFYTLFFQRCFQSCFALKEPTVSGKRSMLTYSYFPDSRANSAHSPDLSNLWPPICMEVSGKHRPSADRQVENEELIDWFSQQNSLQCNDRNINVRFYCCAISVFSTAFAN